MTAFSRAKKTIVSTVAGSIFSVLAMPAAACTSMVFKAQDGTSIYARTMEWGATDLKSELVMVPRGTSFAPVLAPGVDRHGMEECLRLRRSECGRSSLCDRRYERSRADLRRLVLSRLRRNTRNAGADQQSVSIGSVDMGNYLLGNFKTVEEIKQTLPKVRVDSQSRDREGVRRPDPASLCGQRCDRRIDRDRIHQRHTRHHRQQDRGDDELAVL